MEYLYNYTSKENSVLVDNYPWGFRLKTQQRYWIETSKTHGQRWCTQTKNPKTGNWCNPKKSTYNAIVVLCRLDNGHISTTGLSRYSAKENIVQEFIRVHGNNLTNWQKEKCNELIAISRVMDKVTFTIVPSEVGPVSLLSDNPADIAKRKALQKEQEENKKEREKTERLINIGIVQEFNKLQSQGV